MPSTVRSVPTLSLYQLRLPTYEGPLDVLLRLIEREQLAISEVSLLAVLDQFMDFVHALDSPAPEVIAEFVAVAGRLSVLKSRALLPRPASDAEEPDEIDIVRQLAEYRALKMAAEHLAGLHREGSGSFGPGEGVSPPSPEPPRIVPMAPFALTKAVNRWLTRLPTKPTPLTPVRVISLREMILRVFSALERDRHVSFDALRADCRGKQEVIVAFLAVLTLLRRQAVTVTQRELFGTITLARNAPVAGIDTLPFSIGTEHLDESDQLRA
jgi:segregation and condensation protein A